MRGEQTLALIYSMETLLPNDHFHSYQVDVMKPLLKQMSDLRLVQDCEPLPILTSFEENSPSYVSPRYFI